MRDAVAVRALAAVDDANRFSRQGLASSRVATAIQCGSVETWRVAGRAGRLITGDAGILGAAVCVVRVFGCVGVWVLLDEATPIPDEVGSETTAAAGEEGGLTLARVGDACGAASGAGLPELEDGAACGAGSGEGPLPDAEAGEAQHPSDSASATPAVLPNSHAERTRVIDFANTVRRAGRSNCRTPTSPSIACSGPPQIRP